MPVTVIAGEVVPYAIALVDEIAGTCLGIVIVKVLLAFEASGLNADALAWIFISAANALPVNVILICVALSKITEFKVRPVVPTSTVKSLMLIYL